MNASEQPQGARPHNRGFARIITILIFFTFIFAMTGFDLRAFIDGGEFQRHVQSVRDFFVHDVYAGYIEPTYETYIEPTAELAWQDIVDEAVVEALQDNAARVAAGDTTDFGRSFSKLHSSM